MPDFLISTAVAVVVGAILLFSLSRLIGRIQFNFSTAFWCSILRQIVIDIVGFVCGFLSTYKTRVALEVGVALVLTEGIGWLFLTVLLQVVARARSTTLPVWRGAILSFVVVAADFFVASPVTAFLEYLLSNSP
jgi:hypothetical protein